jgi:hypothetical protein
MRLSAYVMAVAMMSGGLARAQYAPPPQYPNQPPPPQYPNQPPPQYPNQPPPGYVAAPPPPGYAPAQPVAANPLQDPARYQRWEYLRRTSAKMRIGGKVGLGVGIPLFLIGMSVGIVAVYNNGVYLCSGISCDRTAAAAAGFTLGVIGLGGIGAGIALLVMANQYWDRSERVRMGMEALRYVPTVAPILRADARGVDGAALAWSVRF